MQAGGRAEMSQMKYPSPSKLSSLLKKSKFKKVLVKVFSV
jgi:hypothetical protein